MKLLKSLRRNLLNIPGWRTNRRIIVIESDDWGSIRMPSRQVYDTLLEKGYCINKNKYEKFDSLASGDDLSYLFEILYKYKDINDNHPVITANTIVTNPNFVKIKASCFQEYHYELFTDTLKRYDTHIQTFDLWKEGMMKNIFRPQFHGREHLNVTKWMEYLQTSDVEVLELFDLGIAGKLSKDPSKRANNLVVALKCNDENAMTSINDGLRIFNEIFGFNSLSFIAPCYTWPESIEPILYNNQVKLIQGMLYQKTPDGELIRHWMGSKNKLNQTYMFRNCSFEPVDISKDYVYSCLNSINTAFRWNKPAIISSHRVNYISRIHPSNRDRNLKLLNVLFNEILKRWPDVEFMSSDKLYEIYESKTESGIK